MIEVSFLATKHKKPNRIVTNYVDRKRVAEFAPRAFQLAVQGLLTKTKKRIEDFQLFIPHQAGKKIIEHGVELSKIPSDNIYLSLREDGNTGAPSVQIALAKASEEERIKEGDLVGLIAFGTGWNYGSAAFHYRKKSANQNEIRRKQWGKKSRH